MNPIIFIPGIEATKLVDRNSFGFDTVWNAYDSLGTAVATKVTGPIINEPLQFNPLYDVSTSIIVGRDTVSSLPYKATFDSLSKKIPDPIYPFGYDWRLSNVVNARRLKDFVQYLQGKLQVNTGFRFVTHSMGGLVFSCYLKLLDNYDFIDKVILCAPPFMGSPYALVHMVKGSSGIKGFISKVLGQNDDVRKIVRTYPGLFEILPVYPDALKYTDTGAPADLTKLDNWQSNIYDDADNNIVGLFPQRLAALAAFRWNDHQDFTLLDAGLRQKIVIVAGTDPKPSTLTYVNVDRQYNGIDNFVRLDQLNAISCNQSGDGTVPQISSTWFSNVLTTIGVPKDNIVEQLGDNLDFHGMFLRDSRVQNIIIRYFQGGNFVASDDGIGGLQVNQDVAGNLCYCAGGSLALLKKYV